MGTVGGNYVWIKGWGWGSHDGISALIKRDTRELALFLSPCRGTGKGICKPGREAQQNLIMLAPWSWTPTPPGLWRNTFPLFKPSSLWYFVMTIWAKTIKQVTMGTRRLHQTTEGTTQLKTEVVWVLRPVFKGEKLRRNQQRRSKRCGWW